MRKYPFPRRVSQYEICLDAIQPDHRNKEVDFTGRHPQRKTNSLNLKKKRKLLLQINLPKKIRSLKLRPGKRRDLRNQGSRKYLRIAESFFKYTKRISICSLNRTF